MRKTLLRIFLAFDSFILLAVIAYNLPPVHERLAWRVDNLRSQLLYLVNPPEKAIFVPKEPIGQMVQETLQALTPSPLPKSTETSVQPSATAGPSATAQPTATPATQPTAIPARVELQGIKHEYQKWNNCGPATLSMALSFWGWKGSQTDTAAFMKPNPRDKNTMPYEMVDFVQQKTQLQAMERVDGTIDLLKRLVAGGFPVIVEKGFEIAGEGWMGHYALINGYEDAKARFITQDAYSQPDGAKYLAVPYTDLATNWRACNYVYVVIYPSSREGEVLSILRDQADEAASYQAAAARASTEISALTGRDQFFAWYNRGSSLVYLSDYAGAAAAYDEAFKIYPTIAEKKRPWRMVWYQTGPYFAYYYTGRYNDVISLATTTLGTMSEKAIEESWVWRARARITVGDTEGAISDLREALKYHPGFAPAVDELNKLGVSP